MRLELPVRWNETDKDTEKLNDMLDKETPVVKYTYGNLSIDSIDIGPYYDIDSLHTMINDKNGKLYCVAVPFHEFKKIFTEVTGQAILKVQTSEEYKATKPRRKKDDNNDDINDIIN
jgi:hypothetical protein